MRPAEVETRHPPAVVPFDRRHNRAARRRRERLERPQDFLGIGEKGGAVGGTRSEDSSKDRSILGGEPAVRADPRQRLAQRADKRILRRAGSRRRGDLGFQSAERLHKGWRAGTRVAEEEGFEPPVPVRAQWFSRPPP